MINDNRYIVNKRKSKSRNLTQKTHPHTHTHKHVEQFPESCMSDMATPTIKLKTHPTAHNVTSIETSRKWAQL